MIIFEGSVKRGKVEVKEKINSRKDEKVISK